MQKIIENQEEINKNDNEQRTRKRVADPSQWKNEITKAKRQCGESYLGYQRKDKIVTYGIERAERTLGARCNSIVCLMSNQRHCAEFDEEFRKQIFEQFWKNLNWDQKQIYIISLVDKEDTQKERDDYKYFLRIGNARKQVCKAFFLSTFGLNGWMVQNWVSKGIHGMVASKAVINAKRAVERPASQLKIANDERKMFLIKFLMDLPKMESHYCRKRTKKIYLEPVFESLAELYRVYQQFCQDNEYQYKPLSNCTVINVFKDMNLGLYKPKNDRCDVCEAYSLQNVDEEEYKTHYELKEIARVQKEEDKKKAIAGLAYVFVMDVEAVKLCPINKSSLIYFKTKLKVHNFSIYNLGNKECVNYWWPECEGEMSASMFVTCVIRHLEKYCCDDLPIILWSDGCTYQNRNQILSNALLDLAIRTNKNIEQKFLVKGHTQMEVDNIHALIENKLENKRINLPSDYIHITKTSRLCQPLEAELLSFKDFKNYDNVSLFRYSGIRPGKKKGDPAVTDLSWLWYRPIGKIEYKLDFNDEFDILPGNTTNPTLSYADIQPMYTEPLKISKTKYEHLQDLKTSIPKECHSFYDNLLYQVNEEINSDLLGLKANKQNIKQSNKINKKSLKTVSTVEVKHDKGSVKNMKAANKKSDAIEPVVEQKHDSQTIKRIKKINKKSVKTESTVEVRHDNGTVKKSKIVNKKCDKTDPPVKSKNDNETVKKINKKSVKTESTSEDTAIVKKVKKINKKSVKTESTVEVKHDKGNTKKIKKINQKSVLAVKQQKLKNASTRSMAVKQMPRLKK